MDEFLAAYGKVPAPEKEEKRLGQMYLESTTGIIRDYGLPLTVEEYSKAMHPLYLKRFLFGFNMSVKHHVYIYQHLCWVAVTFSPGGKRQNRFRE